MHKKTRLGFGGGRRHDKERGLRSFSAKMLQPLTPAVGPHRATSWPCMARGYNDGYPIPIYATCFLALKVTKLCHSHISLGTRYSEFRYWLVNTASYQRNHKAPRRLSTATILSGLPPPRDRGGLVLWSMLYLACHLASFILRDAGGVRMTPFRTGGEIQEAKAVEEGCCHMQL